MFEFGFTYSYNLNYFTFIIKIRVCELRCLKRRIVLNLYILYLVGI